MRTQDVHKEPASSEPVELLLAAVYKYDMTAEKNTKKPKN